MKNPNLVPTPVVNRNGILTTVYKKLFKNRSTPAMPVPAITTATKPVLTKDQRDVVLAKLKDYVDTFQGTNNFSLKSIDRELIFRVLTQYPDHALVSLHEHFMRDINPTDNFDEHIENQGVMSLLSSHKADEAADAICEYLSIRTAIQVPAYKFNDTFSIVRALHDYPQLPTMESYADADEQTQTRLIALLRVKQQLLAAYQKRRLEAKVNHPNAQNYRPSPIYPLEAGIPLDIEFNLSVLTHRTRLTGDDLIKLVFEHPEHADQIAHHIVEERITDPMLLKEIVTSNNPVLSDGLL